MSAALPSRTSRGSAVSAIGRERGEAAHRFTPLAISHIWSAVWIALDVSWKARWDSIMATMASATSVLEHSSDALGDDGGRRRGPRGARLRRGHEGVVADRRAGAGASGRRRASRRPDARGRRR